MRDRCSVSSCWRTKYPGADTCAEEHGGLEVARYREKHRNEQQRTPSNDEPDAQPTYAEYMAWRDRFHTRMDRLKEQQMNVRALLNDLKEVTTMGKTLDELIALSTQAQAMRTSYQSHNVEVPEWLEDANRVLNGEITNRNREALEARLRELNAAEAALKTPGERRADIAKEREKLEQALGRKSAEPVGATS